jgi:FkbM family methyltransferase
MVSRRFINSNHRSIVLFEIIRKFGALNRLNYIWDIGSCDGQDSQALSSVFPKATISSFEPNPDTFYLVKKVADESGGTIRAFNYALNDSDGFGPFHKIDTVKTNTSWANGNPGASSIFKANGKYEVEDYAQIPIEVQFVTGKNLIEEEGFQIPNLIWMDVQGAEGLVLTGLGESLKKVDFIYVELTLKEIYSGQILAPDVLKLLKNDFYWYKNLNLGFWQFDGLFVNKKYRSPHLILRDLALKISLKSNLGVGIKLEKLPIRTYISKAVRSIFRR